jgi:hypothetical protein
MGPTQTGTWRLAFGTCSFRDGRAERHSAVQRIPPIAFICELREQVRRGLILLGEGQSAISDHAGVAHGISNPNATERGFKYREKEKMWLRAARWGH